MSEDVFCYHAEDFPECPHCGRRMVQSDEPIGDDEQGELWHATCAVHGVFVVQFIESEDEEEEVYPIHG